MRARPLFARSLSRQSDLPSGSGGEHANNDEHTCGSLCSIASTLSGEEMRRLPRGFSSVISARPFSEHVDQRPRMWIRRRQPPTGYETKTEKRKNTPRHFRNEYVGPSRVVTNKKHTKEEEEEYDDDDRFTSTTEMGRRPPREESAESVSGKPLSVESIDSKSSWTREKEQDEYEKDTREAKEWKEEAEKEDDQKQMAEGMPAVQNPRKFGRPMWRSWHGTARLPAFRGDVARRCIEALPRILMCPACASNFAAYLTRQPLTDEILDDHSSVGLWLSEAHNDVNRRLKKPEVDSEAYILQSMGFPLTSGWVLDTLVFLYHLFDHYHPSLFGTYIRLLTDLCTVWATDRRHGPLLARAISRHLHLHATRPQDHGWNDRYRLVTRLHQVECDVLGTSASSLFDRIQMVREARLTLPLDTSPSAEVEPPTPPLRLSSSPSPSPPPAGATALPSLPSSPPPPPSTKDRWRPSTLSPSSVAGGTGASALVVPAHSSLRVPPPPSFSSPSRVPLLRPPCAKSCGI